MVIDNRAKALEESCNDLRGITGTDLRGSAFKGQ